MYVYSLLVPYALALAFLGYTFALKSIRGNIRSSKVRNILVAMHASLGLAAIVIVPVITYRDVMRPLMSDSEKLLFGSALVAFVFAAIWLLSRSEE